MTRRLAAALGALLLLPALAAAPAPDVRQAPRWASVTVGDDHACALDAAGQAFCWGNNHAGQLGARTPVRCGIIGESGRRGCYPTASDTLPLPVLGGHRFAALSAGRYLTCGIEPEGALLCWGSPLGDTAAYADRCLLDRPCSFAPVRPAPGRRFAAVNAARRCAVDVAGALLCWDGRTGVAVPLPEPWARLPVAGVDGDDDVPVQPTFCAAARDGRVFCRGDAAFGVLGTGSRDSAAAPAPVAGRERFREVAVLGHWACALAADGAAHCWGAAGYDDATRDTATRPGLERCPRWGTETWCSPRPVPVSGGLRFRSLGRLPRERSMVGLAADGRVYAWTGDRAPRPWRPGRRWRSVAGGDWGECGVATAGALYCWGRDPHEVVQGLVRHPGRGGA